MNALHRWTRQACLAAACAAVALPAVAQSSKPPVRIGVLNDQSSVYSDFQGRGSVLAARMAVEDYGGRAAGRAVEVVSADHQNKPILWPAVWRAWPTWTRPSRTARGCAGRCWGRS